MKLNNRPPLIYGLVQIVCVITSILLITKTVGLFDISWWIAFSPVLIISFGILALGSGALFIFIPKRRNRNSASQIAEEVHKKII